MAEIGAHILVFPYPAQGHMLPLLNLTHQLVRHGLTITILVTPKNLPFLNSLLSQNPSIKTLILPFPSHPSISAGVENVVDLPVSGFRHMMQALGQLYDPLLSWFQNHPSPPVAILSNFILGWTHRLASQLGIRRYVFSPSGAMALSVVYYLWRYMPKSDDSKSPISFSKIPGSPVYPLWQLSTVYRSYVEGDAASEFIKDGFLGNIASYGLLINSFTELERVYFNYLKEELGHDRVWAVGPVLPPDNDQSPSSSSQILTSKISSFLDTCQDQSVLFVSFGSQAVLKNNQMESLAVGLEKSGVKFIWAAKGPTKGHTNKEAYGVIPPGFEDRVVARGLVIKEWAPQVAILNHPAVGCFLTHCGWNSVVEALVAGVPMLAWPMGADQFTNASLLVDELKVAARVCEGAETVPDSNQVAHLASEAMSAKKRVDTAGKMELLQKAALGAIKGGSSYSAVDEFVSNLCNLKA